MFVPEMGRYLSTRILNWRIGALWLLLAVAAVFTASDPSAQWVGRAFLCALFIFQFRLWDDLSDIDHDRERHPERVLAKSTALAPFHAAHWAAGVLSAGLIALWIGAERALGFIVLVAAFWLVYRRERARPLGRPLRGALIPVKYPLFLGLLAAEPGSLSSLLAAAILYGLPVLDEARDEGGSVLLYAALPLGAVLGLLWLFNPRPVGL